MNTTIKKNEYLRQMIQSNEHDFLKLIKDRLGLLIHTHQLNDVYRTIESACIKFQCAPYEYLDMLKKSKVDSSIYEDLITGITIGETYFFRDKNQMQLLKNVILPKIIQQKRKDNDFSLRIWSAGCSSGEEIYTIAIMLTEMIEDLPKWNLHLLGTDINTTLLKKAVLASYTDWSMRSISKEYQTRYFTKDNNTYLLVPRIRDMANFGYLNLTDTTYTNIFNETNAQDLIICRNVLIYFDNQIIAEVMEKLTQCIAKKGFLLLGASDPIMTKNTNLIYEYKLGALFHSEEKEIKPEIKEKLLVKSSIAESNASIPYSSQSKPPIKKRSDNIQQTITELLETSAWEKTLKIIIKYEKNHLKTSFILLAKAIALANLGKLHDAVFYCNESLILDPTNTHTYFIMAMALSELNMMTEAECILRKSIFIDHEYEIGHYQLGLLLLKDKKFDLGLKSLRNALDIVKTKDPEKEVPFFKGLNYGHLQETFSHELEIYQLRKGNKHANKITTKI